MRNVDQSSCSVLQRWSGFDAGNINIKDEDVEEHGENTEDGPGPECEPHPPGLP